MEINPQITPAAIKKGKSYKDSISPILPKNMGSIPNTLLVKTYETMEATSMGAKEAID
jgi:hypothetical protein